MITFDGSKFERLGRETSVGPGFLGIEISELPGAALDESLPRLFGPPDEGFRVQFGENDFCDFMFSGVDRYHGEVTGWHYVNVDPEDLARFEILIIND